MGRHGLSDRITQSGLRDEITKKSHDAASLTVAEARSEVLKAIASSMMHSISTLYYDTRYLPLYSELTSILSLKALDKVFAIAGNEKAARKIIHETFISSAASGIVLKPEYLGYYGQKFLQRLLNDKALPALSRAMAAAFLRYLHHEGQIKHVPTPPEELLSELYARIGAEGAPLVVKPSPRGGLRKHVYFRKTTHDLEIDQQIQFLDAEASRLGIALHDWGSIKPPTAEEPPAKPIATIVTFPTKGLGDSQLKANDDECQVILLSEYRKRPR